MCGIAGIFDTTGRRRVDRDVLERMVARLAHRGPDGQGVFIEDDLALGFRRLAILDLAAGAQPMFSEDRRIVSICNGEFFNYPDLRRRLLAMGHRLKTSCDAEVLPHLFEEYGPALLDLVEGQFSFALFDARERAFYLARDPMGVTPAYYAFEQGAFIFASEIKAILEHPFVRRQIDLLALDQVLTFPGVVSPTAMIRGVSMLPSGHYVRVTEAGVERREYWDLCYPEADSRSAMPLDAAGHVDALEEALLASTARRLQSDVPVGVYLSGGVDSSLIATMVRRLRPQEELHTFSVSFDGQGMCEAPYQRAIATRIGSVHHDVRIGPDDIASRLRTIVYHGECPLRETYNAACHALSELARAHGVPVILTGQGSDELFAGYIGYRFDEFRRDARAVSEDDAEAEARERLWGDASLVYESGYLALKRLKSTLYSARAWAAFDSFDALRHTIVNKTRVVGRDAVHQRSYLDVKLRLADHLLTDHGDRMAMANGVELRHPFLDRQVVDLACGMPPRLKLHDLHEKYVVKQLAARYLPALVVEREKFGWFSHGSPALLARGEPWIDALLDRDRIRQQNYFNTDTIDRLRAQYSSDGFRLNLPFEVDLLTVVLTFNLFLDLFDIEPCA